MRKITAYEADDGTVFRSRGEAEAHDALHRFEEWYEDNYLVTTRPDGTELLRFVADNWARIKEAVEAVYGDQES